jgi:hypothetical protein
VVGGAGAQQLKQAREAIARGNLKSWLWRRMGLLFAVDGLHSSGEAQRKPTAAG